MLSKQRGVGLIEIMVSVVIAMLLVLVIYQIYEISEAQKRTITAGSDAQQNASFGIHLLARDISMAASGIAASAAPLIACPFDPANPAQSVFPIPAVIKSGADGNAPDTLTVFYGGSSTLTTPASLLSAAGPGAQYQVAGPIGFSDNDVIVVADPTAPGPVPCTMSTIDAGGVAVNAAGFATITHTLASGPSANYGTSASLINLGKSTCSSPRAVPAQQATVKKIEYSVNATTGALEARDLLAIRCGNAIDAANLPSSPIVGDVVNFKAQYGLGADTDGDGRPDTFTWVNSTDSWLTNLLANDPSTPAGRRNRLQQLKALVAVRIAIVTRSAHYEKDPVTLSDLTMFDDDPATKITMRIAGDDQHYRYKVLETVVPLRNALWNFEVGSAPP